MVVLEVTVVGIVVVTDGTVAYQEVELAALVVTVAAEVAMSNIQDTTCMSPTSHKPQPRCGYTYTHDLGTSPGIESQVEMEGMGAVMGGVMVVAVETVGEQVAAKEEAMVAVLDCKSKCAYNRCSAWSRNHLMLWRCSSNPWQGCVCAVYAGDAYVAGADDVDGDCAGNVDGDGVDCDRERRGHGPWQVLLDDADADDHPPDCQSATGSAACCCLHMSCLVCLVAQLLYHREA